MNIFAMAVRNLGRNRRRTFLAVLSMLIAMMMVVCMDGVVSGSSIRWRATSPRNETGHVNVATTE